MHALQHLVSAVAGGSPEAWKLDRTWTSRTRTRAPVWDAITRAVHQLTRTDDEALALVQEDVDGYFIIAASSGEVEVLAPDAQIVVQAFAAAPVARSAQIGLEQPDRGEVFAQPFR
jgi:hypothetical protein